MIPPTRIHNIKAIDIIPPEQPTEGFLQLLMASLHDSPLSGYPGQDETIRKTKVVYQWPGMNAWITNYIKGCAVCQQNKIRTHQGKTPLFQIGTTPHAWPFQWITIDLIIGLPTQNRKDTILTIVDQGCLRAAVILPCSTTIMGPGIAQLYLKHVYPWYRLPQKIISDRDPQFTSHFSKALASRLGLS
jgi:hypothetical protein